MIKTIKIGENSYDMKSSAYTMFKYKNETGRDLLKDINSINTKYSYITKLSEDEQDSAWMEEITGIIENVLRLAYVMIVEQNKEFKSYDEWLKELDGMLENQEWVMEVLELGMSPFRRGIFSSQN